MFASKPLKFILLTGFVFGLVAALTSWLNGASLWMVFFAYVFGGNVGLSLGLAVAYAQHTDAGDD